MKITLIVAMDRNNLIGKDGDMPWHLPADLAHFKRTTMGLPILMGRKTWDSIGRPLPGRDNYVLTSGDQKAFPGTIVLKNFDQVAQLELDQLMIIGGGSLYRHYLPLADSLVVTRIDADLGAGDTYFPVIDSNVWHLDSEIDRPRDDKNRFDLRFLVYTRK